MGKSQEYLQFTRVQFTIPYYRHNKYAYIRLVS
jgi:hypothetical protein